MLNFYITLFFLQLTISACFSVRKKSNLSLLKMEKTVYLTVFFFFLIQYLCQLVLTLLTVEAGVAGCTRTLTIHAAASVLALLVALTNVFDDFTALTCRRYKPVRTES